MIFGLNAFSQDEDEGIFIDPEEEAEFPGDLAEFISKNINKTMLDTSENCFCTVVYVNIEIDKSGCIQNPRIRKPCSSKMEMEVLRIIRLMPKWKPARLNGKPIKSQIIIPIRFV
jgi:protein TonB